MQFGKRIGPLARRVAAMQIPVYAGNASFFLLLSVFPVVSLLLSLLPYTPLTLDHLLAFCEEFAPDWTLRALEFFVRTLYASSSAAIISASAVLTLWSASKGMLSLLYGLDAVAEVRETRGYVQRRLLCVLSTHKLQPLHNDISHNIFSAFGTELHQSFIKHFRCISPYKN